MRYPTKYTQDQWEIVSDNIFIKDFHTISITKSKIGAILCEKVVSIK